MTQYGRPSSDISTGNWTTAPLYSKLNEASYDDANFVQLNNSASSNFECALTGVTDPTSNTGHIVSVRVKKTGSGTITETGYLMQGATQIATWALTLTTGYNTITYTLTSGEADSITDYADLRVRVNGVANASGRYAYVSWIQFECPNASTLVSGSKSAYQKGQIVDYRDSKAGYLKGNILDYRGSKPSYIKGGTAYIGSKGSYLTGIGIIKVQKPVYLRGSSDTNSSKPAYLSGIGYPKSNKPSYIKGNIFVKSNKGAYAEGYTAAPSARSSKSAYMYMAPPRNSRSAFTIGIANIMIPDSDLGGVGVWLNEAGNSSNLYESINESQASDSDFIYSTGPIGGEFREFSLTDINGAPGSGDITIFWRARDSTGSGAAIGTAQLRQGNTVIAFAQAILTSEPQTYYFTLTPLERASITNWSDLRLRVIVSFL